MDRKEYMREYHKRTYKKTGNKVGRKKILPDFNFGGVYRIKNLITGDIYIGTAKNILKRINEHRRKRNLENLSKYPLYRDVKKYGWENFKFTVLYKSENKEDRLNKEVELINTYNPTYNRKDGGLSPKGWKHTEDAKNKMSKTKSKMYLGENNPFYGKRHTEEAKQKMREARCLKSNI